MLKVRIIKKLNATKKLSKPYNYGKFHFYLFVSGIMFIFAKSSPLKRMATRMRKWGEHFYKKVSPS